jgi:2-C-methyl-D-erythritol 4-phosphate cytidylyltransferase
MGADVPKQFILVKGEPLLFHTLRAFHSFAPSIRVILVLPKEHHQTWKDLCFEHVIYAPHEVVDGGAERYHSVKAGVERAPDQGTIAVHDGVRPFVTKELIARCFEAAETHGSAIPVVPISPSVREITSNGNQAADRSKLRIVQTPQCFEASLLKRAFEMPFETSFTDEATLVEKLGVKVHLVEGEERNLKITTPLDLMVAEALLV